VSEDVFSNEAVEISGQKYDCPKHGQVASVIEVSMGLPIDGKYCQVCWVEDIAKTCCKVEKV